MNPIMMMTNIDKVSNVVNTIKYAQDPVKALSNNPKMKEVMDLVNGKNPQEVFYTKCKELGVNPDLILGMLR